MARNIEHLIKQQRYGHLRTPAPFSNEMKTIRKVKAKLTAHDAIMTKADKGTSIVILYKTDYQTNSNISLTTVTFTLNLPIPPTSFKWKFERP
jgi:hypothetical protein